MVSWASWGFRVVFWWFARGLLVGIAVVGVVVSVVQVVMGFIVVMVVVVLFQCLGIYASMIGFISSFESYRSRKHKTCLPEQRS